MKYSNLFDTLHSNAISESTKEDVVNKVIDIVISEDVDLLEESLSEGEDKITTYVEVLSTLVNSTISNETLSETIDMIFANESQEVVDRVEEAFKEDIVKGILVEQLILEDEEELNEDAAPVGLSAIRRAAGEPVIKAKKEPVKEVKPQVKPVQPKPAPQANAGAGEGGALKGSKEGSTYRYVNTERLKKSAEQARKAAGERQQRREARIAASKAKQQAAVSKTGSAAPIQAGTKSSGDVDYFKKKAEEKQAEAKKQKQEARITAAKEKQQQKLSKTGSSEPIIDDTARLKKEAKKKELKAKFKAAYEKTKGQLKDPKPAKVGKGKTEGNIRKGISGGFKYSDAVQSKLDKVKGNEGATKAVLKGQEATKERKEGTSKPKITKNTEIKKPEVKEASKKIGKKLEVEKKESKKSEAKASEKKEPAKVYLKGSEEPAKKRKSENFEATERKQKLKQAHDDWKDAKDSGDTEAAARYRKIYQDLKNQANEALSSSLAYLFKASLSESSLKDIFEMVAANKKNANKILKRNEDKLASAVSNLSDNLAKTGKADPELISKAEKVLKHKEDFERRYNNKFNKEK